MIKNRAQIVLDHILIHQDSNQVMTKYSKVV